MATHEIAAGELGTGEVTLTANTVEVVNFAADLTGVRVITDGAAAVWFTMSDAAPTVGGKHCRYLPAALGYRDEPSPQRGATTVKLISSGTPKIRVERA